ncbi:MAG: sulfatase [Planctomycetes bacterium]|nr:sulfatase [Planctomycetota bacterium]
MNRRDFLRNCAAVGVGGFVLSNRGMDVKVRAKRPRPNILLITADDLHRDSLGCCGSSAPDISPNIDAFVAAGLRFNNAHVNNAICVPSRKILGTGLYGHNSGAMGFMYANTETVSIIPTLQNAGYLLGVLGKVGHSTPRSEDSWDFSYEQKQLGGGRSPAKYYEYCTEFFELCKAKDKPFYFMVNSHDPHLPWYDPAIGFKYTDEEVPSRLYSPDEFPVPDHLPDIPGVRAALANYYNSTKRMDDTFGKVLQALDESGFRDNTLIMFLGDNGIATPFAKCNVYLASTITPLFVQWPGVVRPGTVNNSLVEMVDYFPTILDAVSLPPLEKADGQSLIEILEGSSPGTGREYVFTQIDSKAGAAAVPMRCIQNKQFGYIYNMWCKDDYWYRNNNEKDVMVAMEEAAATDEQIAARVQVYRYRTVEELYDLENDPGCLVNLIDDPEYASQLEELRSVLTTRMQESTDPVLRAFENRYDLDIVREEFTKVYPDHSG